MKRGGGGVEGVSPSTPNRRLTYPFRTYNANGLRTNETRSHEKKNDVKGNVGKRKKMLTRICNNPLKCEQAESLTAISNDAHSFLHDPNITSL